MKRKAVAPQAEAQIAEHVAFIAAANPEAARRYGVNARRAFLDLDHLPRRASARLPETVREMTVPGFRGYTLRVVDLTDTIVLIAAFRPGLTKAMQDRRSHRGLREAASL